MEPLKEQGHGQIDTQDIENDDPFYGAAQISDYVGIPGLSTSIAPNNPGDILLAYKELKKMMTKAQGMKAVSTIDEKPKNYLKTTIAMKQHSKQRMNKELLRYSLQQPRKFNFCDVLNVTFLQVVFVK